MKKCFFVPLCLFLLIVVNASAQTDASVGAKIEFIEDYYDFGDIFQGDVVKHVFTFKNTGTAPLVLTNVQTTCGCTAPSWTRQPLAPGKTGEISVQFNTEGKFGMQNKVITVFSNAVNPQSHIRVRANVVPKP